jgi:hypothetical protein
MQISTAPEWVTASMATKPRRPRASHASRPKPPPREAPARAAAQTAAENQTLVAALAYLRGGLSIIPIATNGTKRPSMLDLPVKTDDNGEPVLGAGGRPERSWAPFTSRLPSETEVRAWFDLPNPPGIAVIGGRVSGNLECIDFDKDADVLYPQWRQLVHAEAPDLMAGLNVVKTPREGGGFHVRYRVADFEIPGNDKLAEEPGTDPVTGKPTRVTLIETRGEGGYAVAPGSPPETHESGYVYSHFSGPKLSQVQTITAAERAILIRCARSFNSVPPDPKTGTRQTGEPRPAGDGDLLPGQDFDLNGPNWMEILTDWTVVHRTGDVLYVARPGKEGRGWSGTIGRCRGSQEEPLFHCFTSNAHPFEMDGTYGRFRAYAVLNHGGDFKAAARQLAAEGYGSRKESPRPDRNGQEPKQPATARPAAKTRPRLLQPYRPFPLDTLAEPIRSFAGETAKSLGCDPAYVGLPALAALAGCIGNSRVVKLKKGWTEPCVIWAATVGDYGTLKTPAYTKAVEHLFDLQRGLRAQYDDALRAWTENMREYRARSRGRRGNGGNAGPPPPEPPYRQICTSDATVEALAASLEANRHGILLARDELAAWLGSFRRFRGRDAGSDLPHWLEIFRAGTINIDRKTGERRHYFVRHAAVSVAGTIQPRALVKAFDEEFMETGGAARVLLCMPPRRPKAWTSLEVHDDTLKAYHDLLDKAWALPFRQDTGGAATEPHVLRLGRAAQDAWIRFVDAWGLRQAQFEGALAAAHSKIEAYAARLALLHHVSTHLGLGRSDLCPVGVEAVSAGIELARWFVHEDERVYGVLGESDAQGDARRLVEFIQARGGRITARELQRSNGRKYPTAEDAEAALGVLVQAGIGGWEETPPDRGGHCARAVILCPTPDTRLQDDGDDPPVSEGVSDT